MNQQRQARPQQPRPISPDFDDDAEEATALVDINELRASANMPAATPAPRPRQAAPRPHQPQAPQAGYNPNMGRAPQPHQPYPQQQQQQHSAHSHGYLEETYEDDPHEATQMVDISAFNAPPLQQSPAPQQPSVRIGGPSPSPSFGSTPASYNEATQYNDMNNFGQEPAYQSNYQTDAVPAVPPGQPPMMPGRHEGTQTLDLDDLQEVDPMMDSHGANSSGFSEESTQFVDLNSLAAGAPSVTSPATFGSQPVGSVTPPTQDPLLSQSYQFTPDAVQQFGQNTLIFARNQQGQEVVLKRVWEGHSTQIPEEMRQKLTLLMQIQHEHLVKTHGVFDSHSGCWVELERPPGVRLSHLLQNGPQERTDVALWAYPVADAIKTIHTYSILYANLTPDAIWIDEATKTILIEPFDLLSFEDRGDLGPYGPPELKQPGTYPPTPSTDVYCFAAVVVAALTATPDPNQVGLIQNNKLKQELVKSLELNPTLRPTEFEPILGAIGDRIELNAEPKKGFDKKLIIPLVLIVGLLGFIFFPSGKKAKVTFTQANLPELPAEDRQPLTSAPGEIDPDDKVIVLNSYIYNPPEKSDLSEEVDVDISEHPEKIRKLLEKTKGVKETKEEFKEILTLLRDIQQVQKGKLDKEQQEVFDMAMSDSRLRDYRKELMEQVEKPLLADPDISNSRIAYTAFSIDPNATSINFFSKNKSAKVVKIKPSAEPAPKKKNEDQK